MKAPLCFQVVHALAGQLEMLNARVASGRVDDAFATRNALRISVYLSGQAITLATKIASAGKSLSGVRAQRAAPRLASIRR